jgi:predicted Holliday junction resolvase-like endonuclease
MQIKMFMAELVLGLLVAVLLVLAVLLMKQNVSLRFRLRSGNVKHGKTMEHLIPFSKEYPYDPRGFRFIGDPIDGVQFNDDGIVFLEFKTGDAQLSERQKKIKENVKNKKVEFRSFEA